MEMVERKFRQKELKLDFNLMMMIDELNFLHSFPLAPKSERPKRGDVAPQMCSVHHRYTVYWIGRYLYLGRENEKRLSSPRLVSKV